MQRSDELAPLSRDHHRALAISMWLRRGTADSIDRFAEFWASDGPEHFAIEEQALTPQQKVLAAQALMGHTGGNVLNSSCCK